ncbi:MAG: TAXI family TRAP transporter solute-binding subunit [Planctomycetota bacterium]
MSHEQRMTRWWSVVVLVCFWVVPYLLIAYVRFGLPQRVPLRIASGKPGGFYVPLANVLTTMLTPHVQRRFNKVEVLESNGSQQNIEMIEQGQTELAFTQDGLPAGQKTRSLLYLFDSPMHVVCRRDSGLKSISDLKGKRVYLGPAHSGTRMVAKLLLQLYGIQGTELDIGGEWGFQEAANALNASKVDAAFFLVALNSEAINSLAASEMFDVIGVDRNKSLAQQYPFLRTTMIYKGSYAGAVEFPSADIETVSTREVLICSSDLSDKNVVLVLRTILDHLSHLTVKFPLASQISRIDPQRNFYYPLHPGALAVYQRTDSQMFTPSFLLALTGFAITQFLAARYLPGWWRDRRFRQRLQRLANDPATLTELTTSGTIAFADLNQLQCEIESAYVRAKISKEHHDRLNAFIEKSRRASRLTTTIEAPSEPPPDSVSPGISRVTDPTLL